MEQIPKKQKPEHLVVSTISSGRKSMSRNWSDFPQDILALFLERLKVSDIKRFRAVCKNWHRVPLPTSLRCRQLPYLLLYNWAKKRSYSTSLCKIIPPYFNEIYYYPFDGGNWWGKTIKNPLKGLEDMDYLWDSNVVASKKGWLLLQNDTILLFYNLFSKRVIKLPHLDFVPNVARISASPGYPNCSVFAIGTPKENGNGIIIGICCPDHENEADRDQDGGFTAWRWCSYTFEGFSVACKCWDAVYTEGNGVIYCLLDGGILGEFGVTLCNWRFLIDSVVLPELKGDEERKLHLLQSDKGELLLVVYNVLLFVGANPFRHKFFYYRFDVSKKAWVELEQMSNRVVLLDQMSFLVEGTLGEGKHSRIYFHEGKNCRYGSKEALSYKLAYEEGYHRDFKKVWIDFP
ncbi:F-box/kelch-repeat protein [Quillaja saponaria]|uniref:F-box/kelch-repeat protein n=1 Tax=Quillaja saponaria TaxID=32244 RepID=A0AAD7LLU9_QUISA|nr:F-box/kelch-repeat protein [Quillaja saponaria]